VEESFYELLADHRDIPVETFDPLMELKRLRRRLALRLQSAKQSEQFVSVEPLPLPEEIDSQRVVSSEPVSYEAVTEKVDSMKRTLTIWQRSRLRARLLHQIRQIPSMPSQCLNNSQERMLEMVNTGLTALGIIGVVFGTLSLGYHWSDHWKSDLSLGTLISVSGAAIIVIGIGGRLLASHADSM